MKQNGHLTYFKINEKKNLWFLISLLLIGIGMAVGIYRFIEHKPIFNLGIDFAGGSTIMLKFPDLIQLENDSESRVFLATIRNQLASIDMQDSDIILTTNQEVIIKTPEQDPGRLLLLRSLFEDQSEFLSSDYIGPTIGEELKNKSFLIVFSVSLLLLAYISWRFEFKFGLSALLAVLHDALIVVSMAILFQFEINTAFVAALLTILGYSINDTIIIFDRIRENINKKSLQDSPIVTISNISVSQTLLRSIYTSLTTLAVIVSLIIFGGTTIKEFCIILFIGILSGAYSSIFIASPFFVYLKEKYSSLKATVV